jgi:hypothetical protein
MTEHSPTPWKFLNHYPHGNHVESSDGRVVMQQEFDCDSPSIGDMAHIVHCVNLHDELVEFLQSLVAKYETGDDAPDDYFSDAKTLLAKAKGE